MEHPGLGCEDLSEHVFGSVDTVDASGSER
jgi:hypothetical protein